MQRIIFHIDFDYFFAQVEENDNPSLKGKPVVVCIYSGRTEESGAVSTSNYEARKYGVKAGIPIAFAKKRLVGTGAIFLPARHGRYVEVSQNIMQIIQSYGDKFEQTSIDEAFIDVSSKAKNFTEARNIAEKLKNDIFSNATITCSIGIGQNKLIAKMASDFRKPNGLTVVKPEEVEKFLAPMDVDKIPGIGKKIKEYLSSLQVNTIAELRNYGRAELVEKFGKSTGSWLINASRGLDDSEVAMIEEQKQLSRIKTLKHNSNDVEYIMYEIEELIHDVAETLKLNSLTCSVVGINAIDSELKSYSRSKTLSRSTHDENEISAVVRELYSSLSSESAVEFRRAGVRVEKLESKKGQKTLGEF